MSACGGKVDMCIQKIAQERLGHASITTTLDLYSHVTDTMQGDAAARLDAAFQPAMKLGKRPN